MFEYKSVLNGSETLSIDISPNEAGMFKKLLQSRSSYTFKKYQCFRPIQKNFLLRNKYNDVVYKEQMRKNSNRKEQQKRTELPVYNMRDYILQMTKKHRVIMIEGETGCGKSTQIPQYILDEYIENNDGSICKIVCIQPRRISTVGVAERVGKERGETCGAKHSSIGYHIRLTYKLPRNTGSIIFCTTGMLLQWLQEDPYLASFSHVIIDEVHERTVETDIIIIIMKDLIKKRFNLNLILMSATMNADRFSIYFDNCPIIKIPGIVYHVEKYMLEDVIEILDYESDFKLSRENFYIDSFLRSFGKQYSDKTLKTLRYWNDSIIDFNLVITLLRHICNKEGEGAILIFLPGMEDINHLYCQLVDDKIFGSPSYLLVLLHSQFPIAKQEEVFRTPPEGVRKIVIATNIAETSITINDIVFVIDCGKMKIINYDARTNTQSLQSCWISKANASQRRGRAGRTQPGKCYHLYTSEKESNMPNYLKPEILRTKLENLILKIKLLKFRDVREFLSKGLDSPDPESISVAIEKLKAINCLNYKENLTSLGLVLSNLSIDPHLGKMLLFGAIFSCLDPILTVVAVLDYMDPFHIPRNKIKEGRLIKEKLANNNQSDHLIVVQAFEGWKNADNRRTYCRKHFLSHNRMQTLAKLRKQYVKSLNNLGFITQFNPKYPTLNRNSDKVDVLRAVISAGLYPKLAYMKFDDIKVTYFTKEDGELFLHQKSIQNSFPNFQYNWLVYYYKLKTSKVYIHDITMVTPKMLFLFGGRITDKKLGNNTILILDKWIKIECSEKNIQLLKDIRQRFYRILERIINYRQVIDWDSESNENTFLKTIVKYICCETPDSEQLSWP